MKKNVAYIFLQLLFVLPFFSKAQNNLTIEFNHLVGNKVLVLFDSTYYNAFNEPFIVNKLKYYIADIVIYNKGKKSTKKDFYLIDAADSVSQILQLTRSTKISENNAS